MPDKRKGAGDKSEDTLSESSGSLITDMLLTTKDKDSGRGGLVVEPEGPKESEEFEAKLEETLKETEQQVVSLSTTAPDRTRGWEIARSIVTDFRPVPWFIWRLNNFVLGNPGHIKPVSEGLVFGLRRLLFAAASDAALGTGQKVNQVRQALKVLDPDVVAAVAVVHAICRRLGTRQFERIWRPILDDALLRARIGFLAGQNDPDFGKGRCMLAGFAGRSGLTILIATGELEQARQALEMLATGAPIRDVGITVYSCEPLQVSAMILSAAGCGRDAAFGTASYAVDNLIGDGGGNSEQRKWLAAFTVCEALRQGNAAEVSQKIWELIGYPEESQRERLIKDVRLVIRRGHGWNWLV